MTETHPQVHTNKIFGFVALKNVPWNTNQLMKRDLGTNFAPGNRE
jgi:hypothetical protein